MLGELNKWDLVQKIQPLLERGYYIRTVDGKVAHGKTGVIPDLPWIFIKYMEDASCKYYHEVCLQCFGFIHSRCLRCWKVVFRPQKLSELLEMRDLMTEELSDIDSKLGVEERSYVFGNYGCYWYARTKNEGLENYEQVKRAVSNNPRLRHLLKAKDNQGRTKNLILKRGCTEYELRFGDSREWGQTDEQAVWEEYLETVFVMPETVAPQPEFVKSHILLKWLKFAYSRGDASALQFNDGESFYPDYVKYHRGTK